MIASIRQFLLVACVAGLAAGCSTMRAPSEADPLEGFNRSMHGFNEVLDAAVLRPLAKGYDAITPSEVQTCVGNFFSNLKNISNAFNNLLQGKPGRAGSDLCRFALNSTLGILGFADVATELGFQKSEEDFGQTLGVWGVKPGPYLVLPLLGPSTVRDASGRVVDSPLNPVRHVDDVPTRNSLFALDIIDTRARLLPATDLVDRVALDKYAFIRDAFLARRESLIRDGAVDPKSRDEEEPDDGAFLEPLNTPFRAALEDNAWPVNAVAEGFTLPTHHQQSARARAALGLPVPADVDQANELH